MFEGWHRHFVETCVLLTDAHMPLSYWPYAFQTAAYLINRMPTSTLNNKTPFGMLFNRTPNYMKLKQFGCLCYPLTRPYNHHKLEPKSKSCIFVGYSLSRNAYLCLELNTHVFTIQDMYYLMKKFSPWLNRNLNFHKSLPLFYLPLTTNMLWRSLSWRPLLHHC